MSLPPTNETDSLTLTNDNDVQEAIYRRFTRTQRNAIVAIVSSCEALTLFLFWIVVSSTPTITKDLATTPSMMGFSFSLSVLGASFGVLTGAAYSTFYGRRPIYLFCLPIMIISTIGVSSSYSVLQFITWRFIQTTCAVSMYPLGTAVIGDIYRLEERGRAIGTFSTVCYLAASAAPPVGGVLAEYISWRAAQNLLASVGTILFIVVLFYLPETSHPGAIGIEKDSIDSLQRPTWRPIFINPLKPLWLLRSPNLFAITLTSCLMLLTQYVNIVSLPFTLTEHYKITNETIIGIFIAMPAIGNFFASPIIGRISDSVSIKWKIKRGGVWYPEDRLRASILGSLALAPLSMLTLGIVISYIGGTIGMVLSLISLFINGVGVTFAIIPLLSYHIDVHSRSADCVAAHLAARAIFISIATSGIIPMVDKFGILTTNIFSAMLAWIGFGLVVSTIRHGDQLRAWLDVGFVEY
ncbi:MFS general substrate transporter [Crucibulum laeve]|uniref:MFS general substrate transporter n=1 Tax=Crucibulum laeve TaxID=68775 RepID=A0A5C3LTN7_9AGAR|nr:MFS general substrate transporter [Crucibulum laeve]